MKYKLLKALDVSGFTFLTPVVRLCYGEEPRQQLKEIGQFIVVPTFAVISFLFLWTTLAPKLKTKSGSVPTPKVVYDATKKIWLFHIREGEKRDAYELAGKSRQEQLEIVTQRLAKLAALQEVADAQVVAAEESRDETMLALIEPLQAKYDDKKSEVDRYSQSKEAEFERLAETLPTGENSKREEYLVHVAAHFQKMEKARELLKQLKDDVDSVRSKEFPKLKDAKRAQTLIAEERQYLTKLAEQLGKNNREEKLGAVHHDIEAKKSAYFAATGASAFSLAKNITKAESRSEKIAASSYAKPWTLPDQLLRSLACVFCGFFIGSVIAIPIGVLCGLSPTFMAAITPFIAIFKPVSPIVWLPIALMVATGLFPDPDKHWLMTLLANLPFIGWMKINPAFISSAFTVALCSLWPTLVNTALGVASIEKDHLNVARVLRLGLWSRLSKIVIPSALPLIFAGLRISLGVGWMVLIAAELLASSEGIGKAVWDYFNNGASESFAMMFVIVFVVGVIGFLLDRIMIVFQRLVSFDGAPAAL